MRHCCLQLPGGQSQHGSSGQHHTAAAVRALNALTMNSGVRPWRAGALTSAPAASSAATMGALLRAAASASGLPLLLLALGSAAAASSAFTTSS